MPLSASQPALPRADARQLQRLWRGQAIVAVTIVVGAAPFGDATLVSALWGVTIGALATRLSAQLVFKPYRAQQPEAIFRRFGQVEVLRLLLVPLGCAAVLTLMATVQPAVLFGAFFLVQTLPALLATRPRAQPH